MKYFAICLILLVLVGCAQKKETTKSRIIVDKQKIETYIKEKVDSYIRSAEEALKKKDYVSTIRFLKYAERLDTDNAYICFMLGKVYEEIGRDRESIEYYVKALQLNPQIATLTTLQRNEQVY